MNSFQGDDALFGPEHVRTYRETGGDHGYNWRGTEILLLTTTGRKTGQPHTTPLIHRTDGDRFVIIASKGGAPDDPAWFKNLQADANVSIQVKADEFGVTATAAEGEERERLWKLLVDVWPDYDSYQAKTERQIPVVVLTRR
jgi:deazaflavin-dependent oxidoreductase (nitroreductase family)